MTPQHLTTYPRGRYWFGLLRAHTLNPSPYMVANSNPDTDPPKDQHKHPGGRPTKYRPEFCSRIIEAGMIGKGKAAMAADLDVHPETVILWAVSIPEFSEALKRAMALSAAWWEEKGRDGIGNRNFNANAYSLQVRNRFPQEWQDKRELGLSAGQDFFDSLLDDQPERIEAEGAGPVIDVDGEAVSDSQGLNSPDPAPAIENEPETPQDDGAGDAITGDAS